MTRDDVYDFLTTTVAAELGMPVDMMPTGHDAHLVDDLGFDSLDLLEALMIVEDGLGVRIDETRLEDIWTVDDLIDVVLDAPRR